MKYYSEILKKMFDDPFDLERAEEEDKARVAKERDEALMKQIAYDNSKAAAEEKIKKATDALSEAYKNLHAAEKDIEELQKEYDEIIDSFMNPLIEQVKACEKQKADAIKFYNDNFGIKSKSYVTGDVNKLEDIFSDFWKAFLS